MKIETLWAVGVPPTLKDPAAQAARRVADDIDYRAMLAREKCNYPPAILVACEGHHGITHREYVEQTFSRNWLGA